MIRRYQPADKNQLIGLLRLNTPRYFHPAEEGDFISYLNHQAEHYFVVEENGAVIGCGGINYFEEQGEARLSWDIVHPGFQGKGIGKKLTLHRIQEIKKNAAVKLVVVRTTQLTYQFYEKMGFGLEKIEKDFWAAGFDLYQMGMEV